MTRATAAGLVSVLAALLMMLVPAPAAADTTHVTIAQYAYDSASVTIRVGDSITWMNHDQAQHDVVTTSAPAAFQSPLLANGQSWTFQFTQPGTYSYYCSVHPDMRAEVIVLPADPPAPEAPPPPAEQPAEPPAEQGAPAVTTTPPSTAAAPPPTAAPTTSPPVTAAVQPTAAPATKSLDPMLLVAGLTVAVAVLCLLLISARSDHKPE
jgi:plastocyanin